MKSIAKKGKEDSKKAYVATASRQASEGPRTTVGHYSRRIAHKELVGTINGSVAFASTQYALNPGLAATFPWLSSQAVGWEQYRFHKLNFHYVTRTATSTVGSVILVPDYDPTDVAPATEAVATAKLGAVEDAPWKDIDCKVDPTAMFPLGPRKFVRTTRHAGDLRSFDAGNFFLCVVGEAGADAIGKLWVEYDVELLVPQSESSSNKGTETAFFTHTGSQTFITATPAVFTLWATRSDGLLFGTPTSGVWTPPAGAYRVTGVFQINDTSAELCNSVIELRVAGAGVYVASSQAHTFAANDAELQPICGYFECNGSQTVDVYVTITGAAGTLKVSSAYLTISAA